MSETKTELPKIEPAKSGRSKCKGCQEKIIKDTIRVGSSYQFTSPSGSEFTGYSWYHLRCTPGYIIPEALSFLKENPLEDDDQQKNTLSTLKQMFKDKPKGKSQRQRGVKSPFFEYAKSSRGK
ncbi:MAG: PARP-type zinc finger-containing protein, partial [Candidatus Hodarchaeales archaeon]